MIVSTLIRVLRDTTIPSIDPFVFMIAFCVGMCWVYFTKPKPVLVYKSPNPYNLDTKYTDDNGDCYQYEMTNVSCTGNSIEQHSFVEKDKHK